MKEQKWQHRERKKKANKMKVHGSGLRQIWQKQVKQSKELENKHNGNY